MSPTAEQQAQNTNKMLDEHSALIKHTKVYFSGTAPRCQCPCVYIHSWYETKKRFPFVIEQQKSPEKQRKQLDLLVTALGKREPRK